MKTIIVPTDYSENAKNATEYAAQLAKSIKARVCLLHVFHLPAIIEGAPVAFDSLQEVDKEHKLHLARLAKDIGSRYEVQVESYVFPGFISEVLPDFTNKQKADLVVMGMRGMSNTQRIVFGSITSNILKKANFPLLIVPSKATFKPLKHILLACDYHADSVNDRLSLVKDSALAFNADIRVLHIGQPEVELAEMNERVETGRHIERLFKGVRHSYTHLKEEDIVEGIQSSIKSSATDLLVMIPRKRNFWQSLTSRSNTQRIAFHIDIPLLALPHSKDE